MHLLKPVLLLLGIGILVLLPLKLYTRSADNTSEKTVQGYAIVPQTKRVYVVVFDPILASSGKKLTQTRGWRPYNVLLKELTAFMKPNGFVYEIAEVKEINDLTWYPKTTGATYTEQSYLSVLNGDSQPLQPDVVDYTKTLLADPRIAICPTMKTKNIDEVWVIGGPWFGFYEWLFIGPSTFANIRTQDCGPKVFPLMGLNYERDLDEAVESFIHRYEYTLRVALIGVGASDDSGYGDVYKPTSDAGKFFVQNRHTPLAGCGNAHYPPNTAIERKYNATRAVKSYCDAYKNYPTGFSPFAPPIKQVSCKAWGCTELGYYNWWLQHVPRSTGFKSFPDHIVRNDWSRYLIDMSLYTMVPHSQITLTQLAAELKQTQATFRFEPYFASKFGFRANYLANADYIVEISTDPTMTKDIYRRFVKGNSSPLSTTSITWDKYTCDRTLYWRVYVDKLTPQIISPIQTAKVSCT